MAAAEGVAARSAPRPGLAREMGLPGLVAKGVCSDLTAPGLLGYLLPPAFTAGIAAVAAVHPRSPEEQR